MKQTIKNMELVLIEIKKNAMDKGDSKASKTLINSYLTMLKGVSEKHLSSQESHSRSKGLDSQTNQLKFIESYIKDNKMQELLNKNDYIGINNYATVLDKISQALKGIGKPTKSHTPSIHIEELLNQSIQTGALITFYDEAHRGVGKATALVKKAHELDAVLLTGVGMQAKYVDELAKEMGLSISVTTPRGAISIIQYRRRMKENGYLVDELVSVEDIRKLSEYKLLGGFNRIII